LGAKFDGRCGDGVRRVSQCDATRDDIITCHSNTMDRLLERIQSGCVLQCSSTSRRNLRHYFGRFVVLWEVRALCAAPLASRDILSILAAIRTVSRRRRRRLALSLERCIRFRKVLESLAAWVSDIAMKIQFPNAKKHLHSSQMSRQGAHLQLHKNTQSWNLWLRNCFCWDLPLVGSSLLSFFL
jgi:hypothetical protein